MALLVPGYFSLALSELLSYTNSICMTSYYLPETPAMRPLWQSILAFLKNEEGPTAVEYAIMLALIIVVCVAAVQTLGTNAEGTFDRTTEALGGHHDH
jgi:pilus assembly protein Flp/PilA